jgi:hypothetical protein
MLVPSRNTIAEGDAAALHETEKALPDAGACPADEDLGSLP